MMTPAAVWGAEYPVSHAADCMSRGAQAPFFGTRRFLESRAGSEPAWGLPCPLGLLWAAVVFGMGAYKHLASPGPLTWGSCRECVFTACCLCVLRKVL